jgi:hypothetical protein
MRTIQLYSEDDEEMAQVLKASFKFISNAVYNTYAGQRRIESLMPNLLFLQGIPFAPTGLQQTFRFVGVRPPENPATMKRTIFLDEGFEPYTSLDGTAANNRGREQYWVKKIEATLSSENGKPLMRVGVEHLDTSGLTGMLMLGARGRLTRLLQQRGIRVEIVDRVADVNQVFGK